jgi:hypothetical protein
MAAKSIKIRKRGKPHLPAAAELQAAFSPIRENRRKIAKLRYPTRARLLDAAPQELAFLVTKAAVDLTALNSIRAQHEAELNRGLEERRASLIRQSWATQEVLARETAVRRKFVDLLPSAPPYPYYQMLTQPEHISATSNATFSSPHIEPYNSSAKFYVDERESGFAELSFYFSWSNPGGPVLINADAYLIVNGSCEAAVPAGAGYGAYNLADLSLFAELHPWLWGETPVEAPSVFEKVLFLSPHNTSYWPLPYSAGETDIVQVFRGYDLRAEQLVVPRNGVMVFEVNLDVTYSILGGHIVADFATADAWNVMGFAVLVTVLRPVRTPHFPPVI